jgi:hypothetical protein
MRVKLGPEILGGMPYLVDLQSGVIMLPQIQEFIKSHNYYPIGDEEYAEQVRINVCVFFVFEQ